MLKQYIRADGRLIWGDLSVSCIRDERSAENFVSQIADITAAVEANERNALLNQRITEELHTAAAYVESILPRGLTGEVSVSSRYPPSRELGGDRFDYLWVDDDHLMVYLIDVSGHRDRTRPVGGLPGQNLLRSRTFNTETLLAPEAVLTELNRHFQMDQQSEQALLHHVVRDLQPEYPVAVLRQRQAHRPLSRSIPDPKVHRSNGVALELVARGGLREHTVHY